MCNIAQAPLELRRTSWMTANELLQRSPVKQWRKKGIYVPQHTAHAHTQTHIPNLEHPAERYLARARTLAWTCVWTSIRENDCLQEQIEKKMHASASTHSTGLAPVFHFALIFLSENFRNDFETRLDTLDWENVSKKSWDERLHQMGGCFVHERHRS